MLDQCLGHTGIDVVVRHLVADTVCRPAQPQLGQVTGAEHDAAALVGQPEQVVGAQAGLDVLEGDVVDLFATRERMIDLLEHQLCGVGDVDFGEGDTECSAKLDRIAFGVLAGCEAGQRERQNVAARPVFPVHRARCDDQRVRRVQPTGNPDDDLRVVQRPQSLLEPGDLNVVGLVAVLLQPVGIGRHERKPLDLAPQSDVAGRWIQSKLDSPERLRQRPVVTAVVVERSHPQSFGAKQLGVDVGHRLVALLWGNAPIGRAARRSPRSWSGRPRPGRSSTHPPRRRRRRRRPGTATTPTGPAGTGLRRGRS